MSASRLHFIWRRMQALHLIEADFRLWRGTHLTPRRVQWEQVGYIRGGIVIGPYTVAFPTKSQFFTLVSDVLRPWISPLSALRFIGARATPGYRLPFLCALSLM